MDEKPAPYLFQNYLLSFISHKMVMKETKGLFTLERVGSSPKAQVVPRLEDEGHWKWGTFP
jgi:hypothetical protein